MKSVDSTDHMADRGRKNAAYLANQMIRVIREAGLPAHSAHNSDWVLSLELCPD